MFAPALKVYTDYKSPYAYLAKDLVYALERETGAQVEWLPYTLDIPAYLGSASVDAAGNVLQESRNAHQWRRVKYSYMDCRREATRRGLIIRGPRHIFDSSLAHIGMLYAKRQGDFHPYHNAVYERFWKRELEIENPEVIQRVLEEVGYTTSGFFEYLQGEGRQEHDRLRKAAEDMGVFGVPSYVVNDELFWGAERIPRVRERLTVRS